MAKIETNVALIIWLFIAITKVIKGASITVKQNNEYDTNKSFHRSGKSVQENQEFLEYSKGRLKLTARITVGEPQKENQNQSLCYNEYMFDKYNDYEWDYQNLDKWEDELCKEGKKQSPVNLPRTSSVKVNMGNLHFHRYDSSPDVIRMKNTGKTVAMDLGFPKVRAKSNSNFECSSNVLYYSNDWPHISGGNLKNKYRFHQLHFHWGSSDSVGSEHTVSFTYLPLEVQLFHFNSKYETMEEARTKEDGILALSTFFQLDVEQNTKIDHFVDLLPNVTNSKSEVLLDVPLPLSYFLPKNRDDYFMYNGSFSAPPCTENVQWIVFKQPNKIRLQQLDKFRKLQMPPKIVQVANKKYAGLTDKKVITHFMADNSRNVQRGQDGGTNYIVYENCKDPYSESPTPEVLCIKSDLNISLTKLSAYKRNGGNRIDELAKMLFYISILSAFLF